MTNIKYHVPNPFRDRILAGKICSVMTFKFAIGSEVAMWTKMAGIDGVFIDMEHSALTMREVSQLILACIYAGVSPIVRVPSKAHWHISRVLDAGAAAVVIPHCETVEQVQAIAKDGKYPPLGHRGCSNNQPLLGFQSVPSAIQNDLLNRRTMVIPMIETPGAVDLADQFLAIDGIDGVLVGSNDLCTDMGIPGEYDDPRYQRMVTKVIEAGIKAGKPVGIGGIAGRVDLLEEWFHMGASWSLSGADGPMLQAGLQNIGNTYSDINHRIQIVRRHNQEDLNTVDKMNETNVSQI